MDEPTSLNLPEAAAIALTDMGVLRIDGPDAAQLLQGQLTADVNALEVGSSTLAAWCTPKGRVLVLGFLLRAADEDYLFLIPSEQTDPVLKRLGMYKLRAKVELSDQTEAFKVHGLIGSTLEDYCQTRFDIPFPAPGHASTTADQSLRLLRPGQGAQRALLLVETDKLPAALAQVLSDTETCSIEHWHRAGIEAGEPWLTPELSEQFLPQMLNLDALGAVSFEKGCYAGQEIVARTQYLGRLKRRLYRATVNAPTGPAIGDPIYAHGESDGRGEHVAGTITSVAPAGAEAWQMLAVMNIAEAEEPLHLHHVLGPAVTLSPVPYEVGEPGAS